MLQLQQEDPALTHVFAALRDDPTDNVIHEPAQQHHYGYKYILQPGQALRVQQLLLDRTVNALAPIPVVLPATLQRPALRFLHEGMAHIGTQRMRACMTTRYWWAGVSQDIKFYCSK